MSPLETSALSRRDRLWPAVSASLVAHLLLVGWAAARRPPAIIDLDQKPIVAKLVRLGEKRPEQYLPRKEEAPPAPAPAQPAPPAPAAPAPVPAAAPSPTATAPRTKPPAPAPGAPASPARPGASLAAILSKVQRQQADEARWGAPDGDRSGDSETAEGDQYLALVDRALRANYSAPVTIPERERLYLEATVVLWVEPDGRIIRWRQERPSGNATFDAAVERTLRGTARVPPPPESMRESLRKGGIQLVFRARDT